MKLSIIIPMYNEAPIIADTANQLMSFMDSHKDFEFELIFVNDGSADNCAALAADACKNDSRVHVIGYAENRGKGHAVRYGMTRATGDIRVFTDSDLAYGTEVIDQMAKEKLRQACDIVIGSRSLHPQGYEGYTFLRKMMSKMYMKVIAMAAGFRHSDSQSGIKCFGGNAAQDIFSRCTLDRFAFDLEVLMIGEKLGYTIGEMPVRIINHRQSKIHIVRDTLNMLSDIGKIKKKLRKIHN